MRILLDTNAYSALMRGHDEVADRVRRAEQVVFSTVVAGELLLGFRLEAGAELLSFDAHFGAIDGLAWVALSPA